MALILSSSQGPPGSAGPLGYPGPRGVKVGDTWGLQVGTIHQHWRRQTSSIRNICMCDERNPSARQGVMGRGFGSEKQYIDVCVLLGPEQPEDSIAV